MNGGEQPGASRGTPDDESVISLEDLHRVIWGRLWLILVVSVILVGTAVAFSFTQTPIYEASIKILVGQQEGTDIPGGLGGDVQGLQQLTQTMAEAVNSRPLAEAVIEQLGLEVSAEDFLEENMSVEPVPDTQFIEVAYEDPDPQRAQQVANTIGEVFSIQVNEVSPSANAITATMWEPAVVPDEPVSPNPLLSALLALVLGVMLGVGLAVLLEYRDDSWRSPEEVEQISGMPVFGAVPAFTVPKGRRKKKSDDLTNRLVTLLDPTNVAAEPYRTLRTNLLYALVDDPPKVIVLTSAGPQEGKSTTCANLGVVLAQAEQRTLILDCDLRKPVVHKVFEMRNMYGVVDVLAGQRSLQETWKEPVPGLKVVPVGSIPPNPAELLGSRRFAELLASVREDFDYVLVDAPPVGMVSDAAILATEGDGVLLVLDAQNTRKGALRESMRGLETIGANVIGMVMNNVKKGKGGYYYYGYGYE